MNACAKFAAVCLLAGLALTPRGTSAAAELVILTNQGATPGVKELGTR